MKLRNKLIPLFSALTASSALAVPFATSCSSNSLYGKFVDITHTYVPIYKKAKPVEKATQKVVNDIYFRTLKNNPDLIRDDVLKYESNILANRIHDLEFYGTVQKYACTNTVANVKINSAAVNQREAIIESVKEQFYTIDIEIEYQFDYTLTSLDGTEVVNKKTSFKNKMTNIPSFVEIVNNQ